MNPQQIDNSIENSNIKAIMAFPDINTFYDLLYDRIHACLENLLTQKFTFFINALPRDHEEGTIIQEPRFGDSALIYAGLEMQKKLLGTPVNPHPELEAAWDFLPQPKKKSGSFSASEGKAGGVIYQLFKTGKYSLAQIEIKSLESYFERQLTGYSAQPDGPNQEQEQEFAILSSYFPEVENYAYISLPLIQFAEFDGVVHIIFNQEEKNAFVHPDDTPNLQSIGMLIKMISREYEGIIFDWDIVGSNQYRRSIIQSVVNPAANADLFKTMFTNPILSELKYQEYYSKHLEYAWLRIKLSDDVPIALHGKDDTISKQEAQIEHLLRRNAVMAIMIDSFTHNISAHSLVALERWYKQRAIAHGSYPLNIKEELAKYSEKVPLVTEDLYFDEEIQQLLRFLLEKGAFWTGLTREKNFGGVVNNFFKVLWSDFFLNPLYLGTIANTENILKLRVYISFLQADQVDSSSLLRTKKIQQGGHFLTIDMGKYNAAAAESSLVGDFVSGFIKKGKNFELLKAQLENINIFLPGGIVGEHALFTIIENEIRNVKHIPKKELELLAETGLRLHISFEKGWMKPADGTDGHDAPLDLSPHYYKVGVWLDHAVELNFAKIEDRLRRLGMDIITEDSKLPRLGGTYQDKVCAGMLFNETFLEVEQKELSERHKAFYPWIKAGYGPVMHTLTEHVFEDLEVSHRRFFNEESHEEAKKEIEGYLNYQKNGVYKKFFHLWNGAEVQTLSNLGSLNSDWENLSRFRFIQVDEAIPFEQAFDALREKGIVRILKQPAQNIEQAYHLWLKDWLNVDHNKPIQIYFEEGHEESAAVLGDISWDGIQAIWGGTELPNAATRTIYLTHQNGNGKGNPLAIKYRNHGVLIQYYCQNNSVKDWPNYAMPAHLVLELIETLYTQVCIWDSRIHKWFGSMTAEKMETLGCYAYEEDLDVWNSVRDRTKNGLFDFNFLVMHLSFIEKFTDASGRKYTEENINKFIDNEILMGRPRPHNFLLVITSGRGRNLWNETLNKASKDRQNSIHYNSFVTFRSVEALLEATEKSFIKMDDFDLKYSLLKILFGS